MHCYREVALSMLLRLIEHSRVTVLLTHVLDSCKRKKPQWLEVSGDMYKGTQGRSLDD